LWRLVVVIEIVIIAGRESDIGSVSVQPNENCKRIGTMFHRNILEEFNRMGGCW
jgi:hypothetical protein